MVRVVVAMSILELSKFEISARAAECRRRFFFGAWRLLKQRKLASHKKTGKLAFCFQTGSSGTACGIDDLSGNKDDSNPG